MSDEHNVLNIGDHTAAHSDTEWVTVGDEEMEVRRMNQEWAERNLGGMEGLEKLLNLEDDALVAKAIDDLVVTPDFAEHFGVDEFTKDELDDLSAFSVQPIVMAICEASRIDLMLEGNMKMAEQMGMDMEELASQSRN